MKLFIVPTNLLQTEDSEEYIWPLLLPKLVFQLAIQKGRVIKSVSWPSYKIRLQTQMPEGLISEPDVRIDN